MPLAPPPRTDTSESALAELREAQDDFDDLDIVRLENRLESSALAQECKRQWDEQERLDRTEHLTTEALEVVTTTTAGALSTWTAGSFPVGTLANYLVGTSAKAGSIINPGSRPLRVAVRVGKVLLHSQLAITARNVILENKS